MSNLATITNNILADSGIDDINVVVTNGSYANPAWITSLAWTKITGVPSNIVTGTGTTNTIPRFTGASTIGDSSITDNTNEVSISKRLFLSTGGQSILLTPNLGGASNRIETSALPLEITTTGSAVRLAAGGVTAQLTLASTGVVTLTNLAGTGTRIVTADASGNLSASSALSGYVQGSGTTNFLPKFTGSTTIGNSQILDNGTSVDIGSPTTISDIKLNVNGAGRFVSNGSSRALYLVQNAVNAGNIIQFQNQSGTDVWEIVGRNHQFYIYNTALGVPSLFINPLTNNLSIGSFSDNGARLQVSGAATFSSSVTSAGLFNNGITSLINSTSTTGAIDPGSSEFITTGFNLANSGSQDISTISLPSNTQWKAIITGGFANNFEGGGLVSPNFSRDIDGINSTIVAGSTTITFSRNSLTGRLQATNSNSSARVTFVGTIHLVTFPQSIIPSNTRAFFGNVGIGTPSPGSPLSIAGVGGSTRGSNGYLVNIGGTDGNVDPVRYMIGFSHGNVFTADNVRAAIGMVVSVGGSGNLVFETGASGVGQTERIRISSFGALLVGTTNTYSNLATQGDIVLQDRLIFGADQTGNANNRNWSIETNSSQNGSFDIVSSSANNNWPNAAYRLTLTSGGNLLVGLTNNPGNRIIAYQNTTFSGENSYAIAAANTSSSGKKTMLGYDNNIDIGLLAAVDTGIGWKSISIPYGNLLVGTTSDNGARLQVEGNVFVNDNLSTGNGVQLRGADRPLITRGWDAFTSGNKTGVGRWGVFMEPAELFVGSPGTDYSNGLVTIGGWLANGTRQSNLTVNNQTRNAGIGTISPGAPLEIYRDAAGADVTGGGLLLSRYQISGDYRGSAIFHRYITAGGSNDSMVFTVSEGSNPYISGNTALDNRVKMIITQAGRVGIGTLTPTGRLSSINSGISNTPSNSAVYVSSSSTATSDGLGLGSNGLLSYKWVQSYDGALALNPAGNNVLIGTTSDNGYLLRTGDKGTSSTNAFFGTGTVRIGGGADAGFNQVLSIAPGVVGVDAPGVGNGRFVVNGSGNVGINTPNPSTLVQAVNDTNNSATFSSRWSASGFWSQLEVRNYSSNLNNQNDPQFRIMHNFNDGVNNGYIGFHRGSGLNGGFLSFGTNGTERFRIDTNGAATFSSSLQVNGTSRLIGSATVGGDTTQWTLAGVANGGAIWQKSHSGAGGFDDRYLRLGNVDNNGTPNYVVSIINSNTGFGTTNPTQRIHIDGQNGQPATSGSTQNGLLRIQGGSGVGFGETLDMGFHVGVSGPASYGWLQSTNTGNLGINYGLSLNPNGGNVMIGTATNNGERLYVNGNTFINGNIVTVAPSGANSASWRLGDAISTTPPAANRLVRISINGTLFSLLAFSS